MIDLPILAKLLRSGHELVKTLQDPRQSPTFVVCLALFVVLAALVVAGIALVTTSL